MAEKNGPVVDLDELHKETTELLKKFTLAVVKKPVPKQYLHQYFALELEPTKVCVIHDSKGQVEVMTYEEVDKVATRIQTCLSSATDLRGFIGVLHSKNHFIPSIQLGILRAGCGFFNLGLNNEWKASAERARSLLRMKFLLVSSEMYDKYEDWIEINKEREFTLRLSGDEEEAEDADDNDDDDDDDEARVELYLVELKANHDEEMSYNDKNLQPFRFAYAMETSGTTGVPKFVLVPHRCITPNIEDFITRVWNVQPNDVFWGSSPTSFDPSVCDLYTAMGVGGTILYTDDLVKSDGTALANVLLRHRVSVVQVTPSFLRKIWNEFCFSKYFDTQSSLQVLALGGEKCLSKEELRSLLPEPMFKLLRAVVNLYGLTEMSCWASFGNINPYNLDPICSGEPLLETDISTDMYHTSSATSEERIPGYSQVVIGTSTRICTVIDGEGVVVQEDPRTLCKREDRALKMMTGDIAILHDPFHLGIQVVGRLDSVAKRSGMKIPLSLLEDAALNTGYVKFAQGVEHGGKIYLAIIPNEQELSIVGLGKNVRASFFPYLKLDSIHPEFYPNCIIAVHTIPITENGKLDISQILQLAEQQEYKWPGEFHISMDTIHNVLNHFWLMATNTPRYRCPDFIMNENFYLSGGTSAMAMWLIESVFNSLGIYGSPTSFEFQVQLFNKLAVSTFAEVSCFLESELAKHPITARVSIVSAELVAAHTQKIRKSSAKLNVVEMDNYIEKLNQRRLPLAPNVIVKDQVTKKEILDCNILINNPLKVLKVCEYNLNMCIDAAPSVSLQGQHQGLVIVGSHSGVIIAVDTHELRQILRNDKGAAIDQHSNAVLWTTCLPDRVEAEAVVNKEGSFAYLGCCNGYLFKLSVIDGSIDSAFKCYGPIRTKVAMNSDGSKIVVIDNTDRLYCLNAQDLTLVWNRRISKRIMPTFPAVIQEDIVIFTSFVGGVTGYCIKTGNQIWPKQNESENKACTPPTIWNSPTNKGHIVVCGIPDGFEIRECSNGSLIARYRESEAKHSWFPPIVHECKFTQISEVILTAASGVVLRVGFLDDGKLNIKRLQLDNPSISPSVLCTKKQMENPEGDEANDNSTTSGDQTKTKNDPGANKCFLLSKPSDEGHFALYGLTDDYKITILEPFKSDKLNFSTPVFYKEMIIFGGRDDKLHIIFCNQAERDHFNLMVDPEPIL